MEERRVTREETLEALNRLGRLIEVVEGPEEIGSSYVAHWSNEHRFRIVREVSLVEFEEWWLLTGWPEELRPSLGSMRALGSTRSFRIDLKGLLRGN